MKYLFGFAVGMIISVIAHAILPNIDFASYVTGVMVLGGIRMAMDIYEAIDQRDE